MMAAFGGMEIKCAEYATFGTEDQSRSALHALEGCAACLLANHGMIATGNDLDRAMWLAVETETIARQFYYAEMLGKPVLLNEFRWRRRASGSRPTARAAPRNRRKQRQREGS